MMFGSLISLMAIVLCCLVSTAGLSISAAAQIQRIDSAPPPLKLLSKAERSRLNEVNHIGRRTKLTLELMDLRLRNAEASFASEQYEDMFTDLGGFHALADNGLEFLASKNDGGGKVLDNFKRLEIGLRKFMPRLETIRRDLPVRYESYVRKLIVRIRDARSKATEPLFGETVISDGF